MLSDDYINSLIDTIAGRQENLSNEVIGIIARRIKQIGELSPEDVRKIQLLFEMGEDIRVINKKIADLADIQVRDIKNLIKIVATDSYMDAKPLYDYRFKKFVPLTNNQKLRSLVSVVAEDLCNKYRELASSNATGFLIRDLANPQQLKFQSISDTYRSVIDEAVQAVNNRSIKYETAIKRTVKQLADSGIRRLYWDSGYTQRLDTAVRRNITDGVSAFNQALQDAIGEQIGADGKEISVHINSALDHEPVQGHAFTNEEYAKLQSAEPSEDINGVQFDAIARAITTLNCRHFARSIIIDNYKPRYSQKQLNEYIRKNHEGYTTKDGKHLTMYECKQYQRRLETKIRYAKDSQMAFQASGNMNEARRYRSLVMNYIEQYKLFSKACGLRTKMNRTTVPNYRAIKV